MEAMDHAASSSAGIPSSRQPTSSEEPQIDWKTATKEEIVAFIAKKSRQITGNCDLPRPQNIGDASRLMPPKDPGLQDPDKMDWRTATSTDIASFINLKNRQVIDNPDLPRPQRNLDVPPSLRLPTQTPMQSTPCITDSSYTGQHPLVAQLNPDAGASLDPKDDVQMVFKQTYMTHTHRNLIRMHEMERACCKLRLEKDLMSLTHWVGRGTSDQRASWQLLSAMEGPRSKTRDLEKWRLVELLDSMIRNVRTLLWTRFTSSSFRQHDSQCEDSALDKDHKF